VNKRVIITGASSFTGVWISRAFNLAGWDVHSFCARAETAYQGLVAERVKLLRDFSTVHFEMQSESKEFLQKIENVMPHIFVYHHHYMTDYGSENYNLSLALKVGLTPLPEIMKSLKMIATSGIIFSSSYFENFDPKVSPYGESKRIIGKEIESLSSKLEIPFSKIIIPNPVGPLENEDRFIPQLLKAARNKEDFKLTAPTKKANHVPVSFLAEGYTLLAKRLIEDKEKSFNWEPLGWEGTYESWLEEIQFSILKPLGLNVKTKFSANIEDAFKATDQKIDWPEFWNNYLNWIKNHQPWPANQS
jgi:UDP-glucose 4-epimerase